MVVLAGLPRQTATAAANTVSNTIGPWRSVSVPFEEDDYCLYASEGAIADLLRQVCGFAEKLQKRNNGNPIPAPSRIVLLYVKSGLSEKLLESFGFSVLPIPLEVPDWAWPKGKHWRFSIENVTNAIRGTLERLLEGPSAALKERLEARRSSDPLLLPPRNFHLKNGNLLSDRFLELMESLDWHALEKEIQPVKFTNENFAAYYKKVGGKNKRFNVDARGLVFPASNRGMHGPARESLIAQGNSGSLKLLLESAYRFGTPLPAGYQHDVQYPHDKLLSNEQFACSVEGIVSISGTHANVYPNDSVRPA